MKLFKSIILFAALLLATSSFAATLIDIPDQSTGSSLTAAQFNQILDALKDGTKDIKSGAILPGNYATAGLPAAANYTGYIATCTDCSSSSGVAVVQSDGTSWNEIGAFSESGDYTPTGDWDWSTVGAGTTWPTFNQNTTGTAANLSGTPDLPDGTTATTQSPSDNSTDLATTEYADAAIAALGSAASRDAEDTLTDGSNLPDGAAIIAYGDSNWAGGGGDVSATGSPSQYEFGVWTDGTTLHGTAVSVSSVVCTDANGEPEACSNLTDTALGSAASRDAEDTLTDGANLPDGAAIIAYGDSNWGGVTLPSNFSDSSNDLGATDGAQIDDASGDPIMTFGDGQLLTILATADFQGATIFEDNININDGDSGSPALLFTNESNEYVTLAETDAGGFHIDNATGLGSYIGLYPGASGHVVITPTTEGFGLNINDVGQDTGIVLYVANGTDNLVFDGDFQFADGKSILDASGDAVAQINDGQEFELKGVLTGLDEVNLSGADKFQVSGDNLLDYAETEGSAITTATSITSSYMNQRVAFTAAATATMADAGSGGFEYRGCVAFRIRDDAEEATIDCAADEKINLNGTALAVGVAIQATGAGESIVMCPTTDADSSGTDGWIAWGATSGWASE